MRSKSTKLYQVLALVLTIAALVTGQTAFAAKKTVTYTIGYNGTNTLTATPNVAGFDGSTEAINGPAISGSTTNFALHLHDNLSFVVNLRNYGETNRMSVSNDGVICNSTGNISVACSSYYITHIAVKDHNGTPLSVFSANVQTQTSFPFDVDTDIDKIEADGAPTILREYQTRVDGTWFNIKTITVTYATTPRSYAISYTNAVKGQNGVTNNNKTSYDVTTASFNVTAPSRTGYDFDGFTYTDAAHATATDATLPMTISRGDAATRKAITFDASWTAHTYTLRLHHNDGTDAYTDMAMTYDQTANIQSVNRTGYTFANWSINVDGSGTTYTDGQSVTNLATTQGATVDLYAQWTANTYAVTLDMQDDDGGSASATATYDAAMPAITPPTRTGYTFGGYYTEANGGGTQYYNADGTSANNWTIAEATTLYAKWTANTYAVTFDMQGGDGGSTSATATYDAAMPAITRPTRTGYTFLGYYTETNGGGTIYYNLNGTSANSWNIASATTLYAAWSPISYNVKFHSNNINDQTFIHTFRYDEEKALPTCYFTRIGYSFSGWSTTQYGNVVYTDGQIVSNLTPNDGTLINLYAQWTPNQYTVTFDMQGGDGGSESATTTYNAAMPAITVPTRTGYTFGGYYTATNGGGIQYYNADGTSAMQWANPFETTLYAKWTANEYAVTLDNQSATTAGSTSATATYDAAMPDITVPTRTAYTFGGYYTEINGGGTKYYNADGTSANNWIIAEATTLYAKWSPTVYTITYNGVDGATFSTEKNSYTIESADTTLDTPSMAGLTFLGWTGSNGNTPQTSVTIETGSTENKTYTAKWSVNYIDADGMEQTCTDFTILSDGIIPIDSDDESTIGNEHEENWYVVSGDVTINGELWFTDSISHLIVCDGATLSVSSQYLDAIYGQNGPITIYGQTQGSGTITANGYRYGIMAYGDITINGCTVSATAIGNDGIYSNGNITINRGTVTATGKYYGLSSGNVTINGGTVSATGSSEYGKAGIYASTITLGWTNPTDRIYASSYAIRKDEHGRTISIKSDQTLFNGSEILSGTLYDYNGGNPTGDLSKLNGKTLGPDLWGVTDDNDGSTAEKAYTISTAAGLNQLAAQVNSGNDFEDKFFRLGDDITYTHTTEWDDATSTENNFTAIGGYYNEGNKYFCGTFDGQGHTVSGIRIYKSGTTSADSYQGLFGRTWGATIKNVNLADARITGSQNVGGIVGFLDGTVENCRVGSDVIIHAVADYAFSHGGVVGDCNGGTIRGCVSAATLTVANGLTVEYYGGIVGYLNGIMSDCLALGATVPVVKDDDYGAIAGNVSGGTRTNNYYHDCTVGNFYNQRDAYTVSVGTDVTVALAGNADKTYDYNGIQRYGNALYYDGVLYVPTTAAGNEFSLTLGNTAPAKLFDHYTATAGTLSGTANPYTLTMPDQDVTINAHLKVPYIAADGTTQYCADYTVIDEDLIFAKLGELSNNGQTHWYVVKGDVSTGFSLFFNDQNTHLILCDGGQLRVNGIIVNGSLTIYGQSQQSGQLNITGDDEDAIAIYAPSGNITINGGTINATANRNYAIYAESGNITINGGNINAKSNNFTAIHARSGNITINGGNVSAIIGAPGYSFVASTITLGWTNPTDYIYASRQYSCSTLKVKDGQAFADEDGNLYSGDITANKDDLASMTLLPVVENFSLKANQNGDDYWTTFYNGVSSYSVPEGVTIYTAAVSGDNVVLTPVEGGIIPKGEAVILKATASTVVLTRTTAEAGYYGNNALQGVDVSTPKFDGYTYFVLSKKNGNFGFFEYTGTNLPAHKAYLELPNSEFARSFNIVIDETAGINPIDNGQWTIDNSIYDLQGRKVADGQSINGQLPKGVYIVNGKKVVIK